MLINSVILFLRDALPVLLFVSILSAVIYRNSTSISWLFSASLISAGGIFVLSVFIDPLSEMLNGFGFELLTASIHLLAYLAVLLFLRQPSTRLATIATSLLISVHGTNLYIYFSGFWSSASNNALFTGSVLGLGISFSLALLLYYGLSSSLMDRCAKLPLVVLAFAGARQITETIYFLSQADWLPTTEPVWNTSHWLSDSSEFGHLVNALTGYEASPNAMQVTLHIVALIIPLVIITKMEMNKPNVLQVTP